LEYFGHTDLQNRIYWKYHFLREGTYFFSCPFC
jgi:hypothetical protein